MDEPPTWLDEWVTKWLDEQLVWSEHHKKQAEEETKLANESKPESPSACSPAETTSSGRLHSSATTSRCETDDRSSIHSTGSQPEIYEELVMLRQIDNEQKAKIHTLTTQLEQLKNHEKIR